MPKSKGRKPAKSRAAKRRPTKTVRLADQPRIFMTEPPWDCYLFALEQLDAGTAPAGAEKLVAAMPFRVSGDGVRAGRLQTLAKWAAELGEPLREGCETLAEMAAAGLLVWDADRQLVLLTMPAR